MVATDKQLGISLRFIQNYDAQKDPRVTDDDSELAMAITTDQLREAFAEILAKHGIGVVRG